MLPNPYKLFSEILTRKYTRKLDENQLPEQRSLRSGFSNPDHLQVINQEMEKAEEFNLKVYMAFVEYKKTFDSAEQTFFLQTLKI